MEHTPKNIYKRAVSFLLSKITVDVSFTPIRNILILVLEYQIKSPFPSDILQTLHKSSVYEDRGSSATVEYFLQQFFLCISIYLKYTIKH